MAFQTGDMGERGSDDEQFEVPAEERGGKPETWVTGRAEDIGDRPRRWVTNRIGDVGDRCSNPSARRATDALEGDLSNG